MPKRQLGNAEPADTAEYQTITKSTTLSSGGTTENIRIVPPEGEQWQILDVMFDANAPGSATSGDHKFWYNIRDSSGNLAANGVHVSSNYNESLTVNRGEVAQGGSTLVQPSNAVVFTNQLEKLELPSEYEIEVKYQNSTDVSTSKQRYYRVYYEVMKDA